MRKYKMKRFIAITMAAMMTLSSNAFATEIDLENSNANVNKHGTVTKDSGSDTFNDETTNVWQDGTITEEVRVNVDVASSFTITIPKEIVLNGNDGSATYKVKCEGEIAGDQLISVVPDASFTLNEDGGKSTSVTVTQNDTDFTYVELNNAKEYDGNLSAPNISAGNWSGSFYFNIKFIAERCEHDYVGILTKEATETEKGEITYTCSKCGKSYVKSVAPSFATMSWASISSISEAGNAASMFNIGDEKEFQIGSETYHVQILGFDHDDKSDGTGKAGITVGLKEIMTTKHNMNSTLNYWDSGTNDGGWETSEMRTYLQTYILTSLPSDLQSVIKTVNKVSDTGGGDTSILNTTEDKLFLFSTTEVGLDYISYNVNGQGMQYYNYFANQSFRKKTNLSRNYGDWWLRSTRTEINRDFFVVNEYGNWSANDASYASGIVFGFCI